MGVVTGITSVVGTAIVLTGLAVGAVTGLTSVVGVEIQDQPIVAHISSCPAQRHCVAPPSMKQAFSNASAGIKSQQFSPSTMVLATGHFAWL